MNKLLLILSLIMTFLLVTGAGCQKTEVSEDNKTDIDETQVENTITEDNQPNIIPTQTHIIKIKNFKFKPTDLTIKEGDLVQFVNEDSSAHTTTTNNGEFDSEILQQRDTYIHTFLKKGDYSYFCKLHPSMKVNIKVEQN